MNILPIQFQTTNYINNRNNRNKKPLYITQPQSALSTPNVDFRGMVGLYKGLKNDVTLLSKEDATELVKKSVKSDYIDEVVDTVLRTTEQIKDNVGQNKYYRGMINKLINLTKDGFCLEDIFYKDDEHFESQKEFDTYIRKVKELDKMGCPKPWIGVVWDDIGDKKQIQRFLDLRKIGFEKREAISSQTHQVEDDELNELFFNFPKELLTTVNVLGEKSFFASFEKKYDAVFQYISELGRINTDIPQFQMLLELTNPRESKKYLKNEAKIKILKSQFQTTQNKEKLIKDINAYTDANKNIVANSFKDYKDKIDLVKIYLSLQDSSIVHLNSLLKNCQANPTNEKQTLDKAINTIVKTDKEGNVCRSINFIDSKYLRKMLEADDYFKDNFERILYLLNRTSDKPAEAFDKMLINIVTKKQFEDLGINYDKWTKFNPESKIQKCINLEHENKKQFVIKNLEEEFSSEFWRYIPQKAREDFFFEISKKGFILKENKTINYDVDGFPVGGNTVANLYKNNKPVKFEDLSRLLKTISDYMKTNSFWCTQSKERHVELAKREIIDHIFKMRYDEMQLAQQDSKNNALDITVRKADMNNIEYSLFLGNYAYCCTAVGSGCNQWSAPNYVVNKMVSAIEILDGKEPVGNTMCYIADIDGKTSLLLDNIELQNKYQYNDEIRDMIFEYAEKLTAEIGKPDMPIYAGPHRHKVHLENFALENKMLKLVGANDRKPFYIDFATIGYDSGNNEKFISDLYRIK